MKTKIKLMLICAVCLCTEAYAKDGDRIARGRIESISSGSVTVGTLACEITGSTEFEGIAGENLSLSDFQAGDYIKLKCRGDIAHELDMESESSPTPKPTRSPGSISDDDGNKNDDNDGSKGRHSGNPNENSFRQVEIQKRLRVPASVDSQARGKVEYEAKKSRGNSKNEFKIDVKIPLPSNIPFLPAADQASTLSLNALLSRSGQNYASCTLEFDRVSEPDSRKIWAQYKLSIEKRRKTLRIKKGDCDLDLSTAGVQIGLPEIKRNDLITIVEGSNLDAFLKAAF